MREKLHRSLPVGSKTFYWPCEHAYFTVDCSSKCQRITYASVFFLVTSWVSIFVHFGVSVIGMNAEGSWGRWECYLYLQVFTNEPKCWKILTSPTGGCKFRDQRSVRLIDLMIELNIRHNPILKKNNKNPKTKLLIFTKSSSTLKYQSVSHKLIKNSIPMPQWRLEYEETSLKAFFFQFPIRIY